MLYPHSFNGITHRHLLTAEIASKLGHDDVSKLTPTDIAIEVRTRTFYSYRLLQREFHLFSYKDHGETLPTKNCLLLCSLFTRSRASLLKLPLLTQLWTHKVTHRFKGYLPCRILVRFCCTSRLPSNIELLVHFTRAKTHLKCHVLVRCKEME
jgi:hypothetical protein